MGLGAGGGGDLPATGVRYHPGHVWVILRRRLGWTLQRPERRASERDEEAIARWVTQDQKGAAAESAWLVFFDESAVSLIPPVRRTWSPRGHTPVLRHRFGLKKASMAATLGYRHDHTGTMQARLCLHLQQPSYNTDTLIEVLEQLASFYSGQRVVLIWDGLSAHWSTKMRAFLDSQHGWMTVERLPAYAPELNAVEYVWANLKDVELAILPTTSLAEVANATEQGVQRICKSDSLMVGFLAHTGLTLDP